MAAGSSKKQKLVSSPGRMASRSVESTPLVILQRHDETARLEAVLSARREESRIRELSRSKAAQLAASHRRTRARVKVYRALLEEVENLRFREPVSSHAPRAQLPASRSRDGATPEVFEAEVMCAVNPKFVESAREFSSTKSTTSRMSGRRRLQSAQKRAKSLSARSTSTASGSFPSELKKAEEEAEEKGAKEAREKEKEEEVEEEEEEEEAESVSEEEEEELTQVTWEFLPDTQRTDVSDLLPSVPRSAAEDDEEDEEDEGPVPPLLLTPGRSSHQASSAASTQRGVKVDGGGGAVKTARSLDLYFYPKLLATEPPQSADERRTLACRRFFADQERESARRTRQQRHAERRATRLKSEAERRRRLEEAAEAEAQWRRALDEAEGGPRPQQQQQQGQPAAAQAAPQRSFAAARAALREWSLAAGAKVPPLCPCAEDAFDCEPELCAQNCPFFRDPEGFLRALRSLLPLEDTK